MKTSRKLLFFICACLLINGLIAQKGKDAVGNITSSNTIVNSYTALTADAVTGTTTISVASSTGFTKGDLILIIQMQGARVNSGKDTIYPDLTSSLPNNSSYGNILNYYNSGNNEFAQINNIPNGTSISIDCGLTNNYSTIGKVQIIKVPRYSSLNISGSGSITCPAWNGSTGGVIVVEVDGTTNIESTGAFNATAKGFRGGGRKKTSTLGSTSWGSSRLTEGGYKGESIGGDTTIYKTLFAGTVGRGAVANGGGGGDAHNSGGGGGANGGNVTNWNGMGIPDPNATYAAAWALEGAGVFVSNYSGGGRGGYSYSSANKVASTTAPGNTQWGGDYRRQIGGLGGRPLDYSSGRLFLGGGGGSGDENDNQAAPNGVPSGGNGGGLIYILSYGTVSGGGTLLSDGGNGSNTAGVASSLSCSGNDGAGGGGGGGTIISNSTGTISLTATPAISAKGGNGGNQVTGGICFKTDVYGPGGSGGGGYVAVSNNKPGININGGSNGIAVISGGTSSSDIVANFKPNGATSGGAGTISTISNFTLNTSNNIAICSGTSTSLTANLSGTVPSPAPSVLWYSTATGGSSIASGSTFTTPVLNSTTTYYVGTCPGVYRIPITVTVNSTIPAPSANPVSYCQNAVASPLSATANGNNTLNWWGTNASGGLSSNTAPTPSTTSAGTTTYYVSQGSGSCESSRTAITVTVSPPPAAPTASPVSYCQNAVASPLSATANGTNTLNWWGTSASGGSSSTTAPIPSTSTAGTITYYVSQNNNGCESNRTAIVVNVNSLPNPPTVNNVNYCQNDVATALNVSASGTIHWWGTNSSGGSSSNTAPVPSTTTSGITTYYVSQSSGNCESQRAPILVKVNPNPVISFNNNNNICSGECVTFTENTSVSYSSLTWNFGDGSSGSGTTPTHCYTTTGDYNVSAVCTTSAGCSGTATVAKAITVNAIPSINMSANPNGVIQPGTMINFTGSAGTSTNLVWNFNDPSSGSTNNTSTQNNPSHTFNNIGTYCIELTAQSSAASCKSKDSICIEVVNNPIVIIPNVFTPNGDLKNDLFMIDATGIKNLSCSIFDRWGRKIYNWDGINGYWDGKNGTGTKMSDGVYYYVISTTDLVGNTKEHSGFLQLINN